ncbi:MAG TPA: aromatic aminobenezylarsenical efflux permease ArsG family transporter [Kiritimatiellia bacterium]|nr:aromatic aminobenezylarsenical efflux permease ArsG family transporter [Kiritimatiellia bacterium]HMO98541.1 aromatic aminobenezylarsenical efflux permease ArsG family transporter [Kiritimatiellia bacterium]HMP96973.1 aromatic aminobenezylarsenical efflux permease ArsG family transporter [Kiritimatiellia bacterium]
MTWLALGSALWLGILTSISPCPLATNIAAIGFISRKVGHFGHVLFAGLMYTVGRTLAYVGLGALIMAGLMASSQVAIFLQQHLNQWLGPVLILAGMLLIGLLSGTASLNLAGEGIQKRAASGGPGWALALGVLFALSFCPVSAGLFFGGLIPLSTNHGSMVTLPALYGLGTALPVVVFAFIMAFASQHIGRAFSRLVQIERWLRYATGIVFILAGFYYSLTYVYEINLHGV